MSQSKAGTGSEHDEALQAVALLDEPFPIQMLLRLGADPAKLGPLFDEGVLIETEPGVAEMRDEQRREALTSSLSWSRQRELRLRLADALNAHGATCRTVVEQLLRAHAYDEARKILLKTADDACVANDFLRAMKCLHKALEIWPRDVDPGSRRKVLYELCRCARNCGDSDGEKASWKRLLDEACELEDAALKSECHASLAEVAIREGLLVEGGQHLKAAAEAADKLSPRVQAERWHALANFLVERLRLIAAADAVARAVSAARASGDCALICETLGFDGLVLAINGRHDEAREQVNQALALALESKQPSLIALAQRRLANIADYASDYGGERDGHLRNIEYCNRIGDVSGSQSCLSCLSYTFFRTGQWNDALRTARVVIDDPDAHPALKAIARTAVLLVHVFRGEQRTAEALMVETLTQLRRQSIISLEFFALLAQAQLAQQRDDDETALRSYAEALALWEETEDGHDAVPVTFFASSFFRDAGDHKQLLDSLNAVNKMSNRNCNSESRGAVRAVEAEVQWFEGKPHQAVDLFSKSLEQYGKVESLPERAHLLWRKGLAALAAGSREEGLDAWAQGEKIARSIGWRPYLDRLGKARSPRDLEARGAPDFPAPITRRQRDVLALISSGLSNKEAADRLSLSPRTVEMHVARILERLNCRTRTEAIRKAAEEGWI